MRVGVFTPLLSQMSLDDVLKKLKSINIDTVELGTGNYPGDPHCKLSMLDHPSELSEFKKKLSDNGFSISALSCHGNPLHPDQARAKHDQEVSRKTILLAEKLGVPSSRVRLRQGMISRIDADQFEAERANAAARAAELTRQMVQKENEISVLLGRNPAHITRHRPAEMNTWRV